MSRCVPIRGLTARLLLETTRDTTPFLATVTDAQVCLGGVSLLNFSGMIPRYDMSRGRGYP